MAPPGKVVPRTFLIVGATWLVVSAALAQRPALQSITVDAAFDDWLPVLSNQWNVVTDGDGHSAPCGAYPDADCPVQSSEHDVYQLAVTWNGMNLYVYLRPHKRWGGGSDYFFLFVDTNDDQVFESGDLVVQFQAGDAADTDLLVTLHRYDGGTAHDLVDVARPDCGPLRSLACGDGHAVGDPGDPYTVLVTYPACRGQCIDAARERFEFAIPWTDLGVPPGSPLGLHLASDDAAGLDGVYEDNVGGDFGAAGSTGFNDYRVDGRGGAPVAAGSTLRRSVAITNLGNRADAHALTVQSQRGWTARLYTDPDRDGDPSDGAWMATDGNGDGDFADPGDSVDPAFDSDGDGVPEAGLLAGGDGFAAGVSAALVVEVDAPGSARCSDDVLSVHARSLGSGAVRTARIAARAGGPLLWSDTSVEWAENAAGGNALHAVRLENTAAASADVTLVTSLGTGWPAVVHEDVDCDGAPDAPAPTPWTLAAGQAACVLLDVEVPPSTASGTVELTKLTAFEVGSTEGCAVTATTRVVPLVELDRSYLIADARAAAVRPDGAAFHSLVLTNHLAVDDRFAFSTLVSGAGFTAALWTDPDRDGLPWDGVLLGANGLTPSVTADGGTLGLVLEITAGALQPGLSDSTALITIAVSQPTAVASVTVETVVTDAIVSEDPDGSRPRTWFAPCETPFLRAVLPDRRRDWEYLTDWLQPGGGVEARHPGSSDELFGLSDSLILDAGVPTGVWNLNVQHCSQPLEPDRTCAGMLIPEARAFFEVAADGLLSVEARPPTQQRGGDFGALAWLTNDHDVVALRGGHVEYVVLSPSGAEYLSSDGVFLPYAGTELTRASAILDVGPESALDDGFTVRSVAYPGPGAGYEIRAEWRLACGHVVAQAAGTFSVAAPESNCSDGLDDDGDGDVDCADADCATDPACIPEDCVNGVDDDGDGDVDCADAECATDPACIPEDCVNGVDDDGDGDVDCADAECATDPACIPEDCVNGVDDDGDGDVDCADAECATDPACIPEDCVNGVDDDGDGDVDCADAECASHSECIPEHCTNGVDDDGDGDVDCADSECTSNPACIPEDCMNGIDDDGDTVADCDDGECAAEPHCSGVGLSINRSIWLGAGGAVPPVGTVTCTGLPWRLCPDVVQWLPLAGLVVVGEAAPSGAHSLWLYEHSDPVDTMRVRRVGNDLVFSPN